MSDDECRSALLLVAHGDRGGSSTNRAVTECVARLRDILPIEDVSAGFLKGEPTIETALHDLHDRGFKRVLLYPFMMSNGYFATNILPRRLESVGKLLEVLVLPPLGLLPGLAGLVLSQATAAADRAGYTVETTRLLIAGHGSKISRASAAATRDIASRIGPKSRFRCVATAFLEEPPFLQTELASEPGPVVVSGFFSGEGLHGGADVVAAIAESGVEATYAGPIGAHADVPRLIAADIETRLGAVSGDGKPYHSSSSSERPA